MNPERTFPFAEWIKELIIWIQLMVESLFYAVFPRKQGRILDISELIIDPKEFVDEFIKLSSNS
jgi:hypothetical protein